MKRTQNDEKPSKGRMSTRREFLKGSGALALTLPALARGQAAKAGQVPPRDPREPVLAYVGTYSSPQAPQEPGNGKGIYLVEMNPSTGDLRQREVFKNDQNPSWVSLHPSRKYLYCCNETETYQGAASGSVSAYRIAQGSGRLELMNTVPSGGAGPAYLSVHPSGKYILVANYGGGTAALLPVEPNGTLKPASYIHHDEGQVGPQHATSAPRGNFSISGHHHPHVHMFHADPTGGRVVWTDLGLDHIFVAEINLEDGTLSPNSIRSFALPPGDGPRHFVFHHNGRWMYSVEEEGSTVVQWDYHEADGMLKKQQTLSTLPSGFAGTNFPSEVRITPDGRFLYVANRRHDSIAFFAIGREGRLSRIGEEWTRGDQPRSITIDPTGNFLYSLNQHADAVTVFRIHRESGRLAFTGIYVPIGSPACMVFLS